MEAHIPQGLTPLQWSRQSQGLIDLVYDAAAELLEGLERSLVTEAVATQLLAHRQRVPWQ